MLFENFYGLVRIIVVGTLSYVALVAILRISGKRTLASMNAFDFVVTVALGSTLATALLSKDVPFVEGMLAFSLLAGLQFITATVARRFKLIEKIVKSKPRVLLLNGIIDEAALRDERVSMDEVKAAVRKESIGDLSNVAAVVLETDGSFSVIAQDKAGSRSAFP